MLYNLRPISLDFNHYPRDPEYQERMLVNIIRKTNIAPGYWGDRPIPESFYMDRPNAVCLVKNLSTTYLEPYFLSKDMKSEFALYPLVVIRFEEGQALTQMFNWLRLLSPLLNMDPELHYDDEFSDSALKALKNDSKVMKEAN